MRLLNTNEDLRKEVRIDTFQTMVGKDHVEYTPAFTPQSAQAIGAALKDSRFFPRQWCEGRPHEEQRRP